MEPVIEEWIRYMENREEKLYIVLVRTPGIFATLIRIFLRFEFIHVVLGLDKSLEHCYSFGRRDARYPIISGFEREELDKVQAHFKNARIAQYEITCTREQKKQVVEKLRYYTKNNLKYKYTILGIPCAMIGKPYHQKRHYMCSQFVARTLEDCGIRKFDKHYTLMTPKDFYEMEDKKTIYIGSIKRFLEKQGKSVKN